MKVNTVTVLIFTGLSFAGTALCMGQQTTHLGPRLSLDTHAPSNVSTAQNVSVTQGNLNEKNFTFDELFALQKQFLDNFIAPQNDVQVRLYLSDLHPTCANSYSRQNQSIHLS